MGIDIKKLKSIVDADMLPTLEDIECDNENIMQSSYFRCEYTEKYSFPIITQDLITELHSIIGSKKVIELGCGSGYLAYWYKQLYKESNYTTCDTNDWFSQTFVSIDKVCDYSNLDLSDHDIIILSWPNYDSKNAELVLSNMNSGQTLIYCGEEMGGCCATNKFFKYKSNNFTKPKYLETQISFFGIHDWWSTCTKI